MAVLGQILMVVGFCTVAVGAIWLLIVAFQESLLWGVGCILVPLVSLVFVAMHWDEAGRPFGLQILGTVLVFAGMFASASGG